MNSNINLDATSKRRGINLWKDPVNGILVIRMRLQSGGWEFGSRTFNKKVIVAEFDQMLKTGRYVTDNEP